MPDRIIPMKYATLLGLAIVQAFITVNATPAAAAKVDVACLRDLQEAGITLADAKRVCDPKNKVKPNEFGWLCDGGGGTPYRVKGQGARLRRDSVCE
jgi:hypothetical protein